MVCSQLEPGSLLGLVARVGPVQPTGIVLYYSNWWGICVWDWVGVGNIRCVCLRKPCFWDLILGP